MRAEFGLAGSNVPLVVLTAGGGVDGGQLMETYLQALSADRRSGLPKLASLLVTGPTLAPERLARLQAEAAALPNVTLRTFTDDLAKLSQCRRRRHHAWRL